MSNLAIRQETALQIINSSSSISTALRLVAVRQAKNADGKNAYPRYGEGSDADRLRWLNGQLSALALINHTEVDATTLKIDILALDRAIMDDASMRDLTLIEIQEAFLNGVKGAYGDYYGLTSVSLSKFLGGFLKSDKKQEAHNIIRHQEDELMREANSRFYKEMLAAHERGDIALPDEALRLLSGKPRVEQKVNPEDSAAHREKIRIQREEIMRQAGKK